MTTCDEIRPRLSAYVDGELSEFEQERARRHVASCQACTQELRELEETATLLDGLEEADPPDTLGPGLRRRIRRRAAGLVVAVALLLLAILPTAQMAGIVLRPDLPLWAKAGFALATSCLGLALGLLVFHLLRHARHLVVYGYLSGGQQ